MDSKWLVCLTTSKEIPNESCMAQINYMILISYLIYTTFTVDCTMCATHEGLDRFPDWEDIFACGAHVALGVS